jgi:hypothetical protein
MMNKLMQGLLLSLCCLLPVASAQSAPGNDPPIPKHPDEQGRSYLVYANGLEISPEGDTSTMVFSGGVSIEGRGLRLYTDTLSLTLRSDILPQSQDIRLPEGELPDGESPTAGEDLSQMARDLKLPKARFQVDSVRSIKAVGNVRFEGHGVQISTHSVESRDGGLNWYGTGRTTLSMSGSGKGNTQISANGLHLDSVSSIVTASGKINGVYTQRGNPDPLLLEAESCSFDMNSGIVTVPGEMTMSYGTIDMQISPLADAAALQGSVARELAPLVPKADDATLNEDSPGVSIDLRNRIVRARGSVHVEDPQHGIELNALNLDYLMDEGRMTAWQVELQDIGHGMTLNAPKVEIHTEERRLEASGMPVLRYLSSSYTGERITVNEDDEGLLVIEIEGQQLATLNLDELEHFGDEAEE